MGQTTKPNGVKRLKLAKMMSIVPQVKKQHSNHSQEERLMTIKTGNHERLRDDTY